MSEHSPPTTSRGSSRWPPGLRRTKYVVARRVERAQQLLRESDDLALAKIAADADIGLSTKSQFFTQAGLRRHAETIPQVRKNREKLRKALQELARCTT